MKYKALPRDADIDPEIALLQGALAIDAAGLLAEKQSDVEGLLNVSAMWMKFSEQIVSFTEKAEEKAVEFVKSKNKVELGFQRAESEEETEEIIVEEEEEID